MKYSDYTFDKHIELGEKLCSDNMIYYEPDNLSLGYKYITNEDLMKYLNNKNITLDLINDIIKIFSHTNKLKFRVYGSTIINPKTEIEERIIFPATEWINFKPILFSLITNYQIYI